jgi:hypothetical protein
MCFLWGTDWIRIYFLNTRCLGVQMGYPVPGGKKNKNLALQFGRSLKFETVEICSRARLGPEKDSLERPSSNCKLQTRPLVREDVQLPKDNFQERNGKLVTGPRWRPDTRPDWPTDRRSQDNFDLDLDFEEWRLVSSEGPTTTTTTTTIIIIIIIIHVAGWQRHSVLDLHSGGAHFETGLGH